LTPCCRAHSVCTMTTSTPAPVPLTILPPSGAKHLGDWELSDDDRIAHRHFHCAEHTTPGGLRVKVHGLQYVDGGVAGVSVAISDEHGDVMVDSGDVEALAAALRTAANQLDQIIAA
jgi:hypothetical protein